MKNIVWRLLRRNISAGQLAGYALANFVGLAIVLTAIQFYRDINNVWDADDSFISRDYLIISKKVEGVNLGSLLGGSASKSKGDPNSFTPEEKADLESQPWARRVGEFTSAAFNVSASVEMGGRGMSTYMFLESIPDDFFDVQPRGWTDYQPGDTTKVVPIIISKDYLTLYNFGFASSRGLPQISESIIGKVPLRLSLSGRGVQQYVNARIVGFSNRLNTIAVPEQFMEWANGRFAETSRQQPSRLIIEVSSPGDPAIGEYLDEHNFESAGDKIDNSKGARFFAIVTGAVIAVGAVISLLAFFILLLSIYLLLQKNREKIRDLILLGYTPSQVATHYYNIVLWVNAGVLVASIGVMLLGSHLWSVPLSDLGVKGTSPLVTIIIAVVIVSAITAGNLVAISRNVRKTID